MSSTVTISMEDVVKAFPTLINQWCEQQSQILKRPKFEMCQLAVKTFSSIYSKDHIRKSILKEYKVGYRRNNAKKSWYGRAKDKVSSFDSSFGSGLVEGTKSGRPK